MRCAVWSSNLGQGVSLQRDDVIVRRQLHLRNLGHVRQLIISQKLELACRSQKNDEKSSGGRSDDQNSAGVSVFREVDGSHVGSFEFLKRFGDDGKDAGNLESDVAEAVDVAHRPDAGTLAFLVLTL